MLQRRSPAEPFVEDRHRGVRIPRHVAGNRRHGRHHRLDLTPQRGPGLAGQRIHWIARQPVPLPPDLCAVHVEIADERRHVDQFVVVLRRELPAIAGVRQARRDTPITLCVKDDFRWEGQVLPLRIEEEIRAVEEHEVTRGPCLTHAELVGAVVELDRHASRAGRVDPPGVEVGLVPADLARSQAGRDVAHVLREVVELIRARRPRRQRQSYCLLVVDVERHRDMDEPVRCGRRIEGYLVAHVADAMTLGRLHRVGVACRGKREG